MIEAQACRFMQKQTLDIIFNHYDHSKHVSLKVIFKNKTPTQVARILFQYPLNKLIPKIKAANEDSKEIMKKLFDGGIIKRQTGLHDNDIRQIQSVLKRHMKNMNLE